MIFKKYSNFKYNLLSKLKFLFEKDLVWYEKVLISYRLIILLTLVVCKKKNYYFYGYFGKETFKVYLDTLRAGYGSRGYFLSRNKQEPFLQFGDKFLNKGDIVIDGGANQGIFSLSFKSKIKDEGKVISIEPFKYAVNKLRKNFLLNNFKNLIIYKNTLSNNNKINKIYFSNNISDASVIFKRGNNYKLVKSISIDRIVKLEKLEKLKLIKLDIEGAEYQALKGAYKTINKFKPILYIEVSNYENLNKIKNFLKQFRYDCFCFDEVGNLKSYKKFNDKNKNLIFKIKQLNKFRKLT